MFKVGDLVELTSSKYNACIGSQGIIMEAGERPLVRIYLEVDTDVEQDQWFEVTVDERDLIKA